MASTAKQTKGSGRHGNVQPKFNMGVKVPAEIKKLRGTYDKNNENIAARRIGAGDASELMLPVDVPEFMVDCPETLTDPLAIREWNLFIKPLIAADVIKLTDLRTAEIYCDMWASYLNFKEKFGYPSVKLADPLVKLMTQMGLTPVSRHKVVRIMKDKKAVTPDEWGRILNHEDDEDA